MVHYKTLTELHRENLWPEPENALLSMIGCQNQCKLGDRKFTVNAYVIGFKKLVSGKIIYGRTPYDSNSGSMYFMRPRQIIELCDLTLEENSFMLFIHENYLQGSPLFKAIGQCGFFDYEVNEALHLSPKEEAVILDLFDKIIQEYNTNQDLYSKEIILGHVTSILNFSQRFYKRQFIHRQEFSGNTVTKFQQVLKEYVANHSLEKKGLPTVNHLAGQLNLSPRYLSDLLKQETGKNTMELIHLHLISEAKDRLLYPEKNIAEIAYELGFEDTSYFSRIFKKMEGLTPVEFRRSNN